MADLVPLHPGRDPAGEVVNVYYGAADSVVGVASARLDDLLAGVRHASGPWPRGTSEPRDDR